MMTWMKRTRMSRTPESYQSSRKRLNQADFLIRHTQVRQLGKVSDITILGSGSIVQQFANLDLIDEYRLIVMPIILGTGKPLLRDVKQTQLKVLEARAFGNGIVALRYAIAA